MKRLNLVLCLFCCATSVFGQEKKDTLRHISEPVDWVSSTGAVSTVSGKYFKPYLTQRLDHAFQGILPGLTVLQGQMEPGQQSAVLRVRGQSTFQNNNPLVFVDGFEASMDNLSVHEIANVKVLKDAASLAAFGMRGGNGVIWITTKRGKEGAMNISFDTRLGISNPVGMPTYLNAVDYARLFNEAVSNDQQLWSPMYDDEDLDKYSSQTDPLFFPDVDWRRETINPSVWNRETSLSFSGGFSNVKYYVFLGHLGTPKFYRNSDEEGYLSDKRSTNRYNFRSNVDVALNKVFSISATIGGSLLNNARPNIGNLWDVISGTPPNAYLPKNPDGTWGGNSTYYNNPAASVFALGRQSNHERKVQTVFTIKEDLDNLVKGLSLHQAVSFDNRHNLIYNVSQDYARFAPRLNEAATDTTYLQVGNDVPYAIAQNQNQYWRISYRIGGDFQRQFGHHIVTANSLFRLSQYHVDGDNPPLNDINVGNHIGYVYDQRYFADFTLGIGGSENFAAGQRYGVFPSVAVGWLLTAESFLKESDWLDKLKIRGSFGLVGNSDIGIGRFLYQSYYPSGSNYILGTNGTRSVGSLREGVVGNPHVTWERSRIANIGIDGELFDRRLSFSIDVFDDRRNNILTRRDATSPGILGIDLPYENIGEVQNRGAEGMVSYKSPGTNQLTYQVSTTLSFSRNKIRYQDEIVRSEPYLYRTGRPIGQVFGLEAIGLFQSEEELGNTNTPYHSFAPVRPGDIRYRDQNNDGIINLDDQIAIGYGNVPELTGAISANVGYQGFDLSLLMAGVANRTIYVSGNDVWAFRDNGQTPSIALDRWVYYPEQGLDTRANASYPRLSATNNSNNERISTFWTRNGNFLRLKYLELGYTIRNRALSRAKIDQLRVSVSGNNLITFSENIFGLDPESTGAVYPNSRSYLLGVNIVF